MSAEVFIPYKPHTATLVVVDQANAIIEDIWPRTSSSLCASSSTSSSRAITSRIRCGSTRPSAASSVTLATGG